MLLAQIGHVEREWYHVDNEWIEELFQNSLSVSNPEEFNQHSDLLRSKDFIVVRVGESFDEFRSILATENPRGFTEEEIQQVREIFNSKFHL